MNKSKSPIGKYCAALPWTSTLLNEYGDEVRRCVGCGLRQGVWGERTKTGWREWSVWPHDPVFRDARTGWWTVVERIRQLHEESPGRTLCDHCRSVWQMQQSRTWFIETLAKRQKTKAGRWRQARKGRAAA